MYGYGETMNVTFTVSTLVQVGALSALYLFIGVNVANVTTNNDPVAVTVVSLAWPGTLAQRAVAKHRARRHERSSSRTTAHTHANTSGTRDMHVNTRASNDHTGAGVHSEHAPQYTHDRTRNTNTNANHANTWTREQNTSTSSTRGNVEHATPGTRTRDTHANTPGTRDMHVNGEGEVLNVRIIEREPVGDSTGDEAEITGAGTGRETLKVKDAIKQASEYEWRAESATWCIPARDLEPVLDAAAREGVRVEFEYVTERTIDDVGRSTRQRQRQ